MPGSQDYSQPEGIKAPHFSNSRRRNMPPQSNQTTSPGPAQTASDVKWYSLTPAEVATRLQVDPVRGLSAAEAQQRLQQYGPNKPGG